MIDHDGSHHNNLYRNKDNRKRVNLSGKKNVFTNIKGEDYCFDHSDNAEHEMYMSSCIYKGIRHLYPLKCLG